MNTSRTLSLLALSTTALFLGGCGTTTTTIDPTRESLNTSGINPQDWAKAADELTQSLLSSGVLEKAPRQPAVLAIDRIVNNTTLMVDTDLLIKKIRVGLSQTGKIAVTNTMGMGERATVAAESAEMQAMLSGKKEQVLAPDYTLYTKLIQQTDTAKKVTQNTYSFQMSLVEVKTGLAVWEGERTIAKQTKGSTVGW